MARSALITAIFVRRQRDVCSHTSHSHLITLLEWRDRAGFVAGMLAHLEEIEARLDLADTPPKQVDLKTALRRRGSGRRR